MKETECCGSTQAVPVIGEYVCYCSKVTEQNIIDAIKNGAKNVAEVIKATGAMQNSNCAVHNPKGSCCYSDIVFVFNKHSCISK